MRTIEVVFYQPDRIAPKNPKKTFVTNKTAPIIMDFFCQIYQRNIHWELPKLSPQQRKMTEAKKLLSLTIRFPEKTKR